ncbi:hypothetical protein BGZ98_006971 [Dissophora globulifera]|nr:hypothetical protein BGZ98_006971 [Dissophora globulifera]
MASVWTQERSDTRSGTAFAADVVESDTTSLMPKMLSQSSRILLSPVPASMVQGSPKSSMGSSPSPSSSNTVTLYPVESVPSHLLCAICTLPYENPVHFLPCCHVFCQECIQLWIGMNLGDDLLQNELRRIYPAEGDMVPGDGVALHSGQEDTQHSSQTQQQFMVELARMGESGYRPGGSLLPTTNFYDSFHHLSPAQRQILQQQQNQQRIAVLLETREIPKCPMCRTGLHINGWDKIEEQIKVPVTWLERGTQRPVSGVERRRTRPDGFAVNGVSRRREEAIGEEEEGDEEIEMEHVRMRPGRNNNGVSNTNALSPYPSLSPSSIHRSRLNNRSDRVQSQPHYQPTVQTDRRLWQQRSLDGNEDEEIQSPTTAVIGRRPSEWMRYQQRQLQAQQEQQQANRVRPSATAVGVSDQDDTPHPHSTSDISHNEREERIRRLFREQETQEELLRSLTARAASIIEVEQDLRNPESGFATAAVAPTTESGASIPQSYPDPPNDQPQASRFEDATDVRNARSVIRQSLLQIDTSLSRPSSRGSQLSQDSSSHSQQLSQDNDHLLELETGEENHPGQEQEQHSHMGISGNDIDDSTNNSDDGNEIISAIQQGTHTWAQRPSSLQQDLNEGQVTPTLSPDDQEGNTSISDSVSDSTRSLSSLRSPTAPLSPFNESTASFRTSSTFSQPLQRYSSTNTPYSHSSSQTQWARHSLSLQMPTLESGHSDQSWNDHSPEEEEHVDCFKEGPSTSVVAEDNDILPSSSLAPEKRSSIGPQEEGTADLRTPVPGSDSAAESLQGSSSRATLGFNLASSSNSTWKPASSTTSTLIGELDIRSPIAIMEGSRATIADMQIDANTLARARSYSVALSDEDLPTSSIRERPSPVDSPIPTPSTARPRNRFPAGISLSGEDEEELEGGEDGIVEAADAYTGPAQDETVDDLRNLPATEATAAQHNTLDNNISRETGSQQVDGIPRSASDAVERAEDSSNSSSTTIHVVAQGGSSPVIQDPLSEAMMSAEFTAATAVMTGPSSTSVLEHIQTVSQITTPLVRPLRSTMSSPPPLPLPLPVPIEERAPASTATMSAANRTSFSETDRRPNFSEHSRSISIDSGRRTSSGTTSDRHQESVSSPNALSDLGSLDAQQLPDQREFGEESPLATTSERVQEHIQYRTLVRYQPQLPKAHVMSDLISQTRVECPHKSFGCREIMEVQNAVQHGRDQCQFRLVMCPRPHCGLWMRADQIADHVVMIEPSSSLNDSASSSSSGRSPRSSSSSSSSAVRSLSRGVGASLQQRQTNGARLQQRSHRSQRSISGHSSNSPLMKQLGQDTATAGTITTSSNPNVRPCAGLTWEREQLARATGIIGHLTEENSSLRQMIQKLTLQNSKLMKDKDRWQRYANIGL